MQPAHAPDLSDLVVIMAHDLKNPLAALMTNLHFLQGALTDPDPDVVDALGDSVTLCEVLDRFLRNLDLLGRNQEIVARKTMVPIGAVAQEAVSRAQTHATTTGVELRLEGEASEAPALVDRDLFARALENVIANSIEQAPSGSQVHVAVTAGENEAAVAVTDARESVPVLASVEGAKVQTVPGAGKRVQGVYGRGLALLCADIAARATGATLEIDGGPRACRLRLVAPVRE